MERRPLGGRLQLHALHAAHHRSDQGTTTHKIYSLCCWLHAGSGYSVCIAESITRFDYRKWYKDSQRKNFTESPPQLLTWCHANNIAGKMCLLAWYNSELTAGDTVNHILIRFKAYCTRGNLYLKLFTRTNPCNWESGYYCLLRRNMCLSNPKHLCIYSQITTTINFHHGENIFFIAGRDQYRVSQWAKLEHT